MLSSSLVHHWRTDWKSFTLWWSLPTTIVLARIGSLRTTVSWWMRVARWLAIRTWIRWVRRPVSAWFAERRNRWPCRCLNVRIRTSLCRWPKNRGHYMMPIRKRWPSSSWSGDTCTSFQKRTVSACCNSSRWCVWRVTQPISSTRKLVMIQR